MIDADVQGLKLTVEEAVAHKQTHLQLPIALVAKLVVEIEGRTIEYRRMLEAIGPSLAAIVKWREGELESRTAMKMISAAVDTWQGGKS